MTAKDTGIIIIEIFDEEEELRKMTSSRKIEIINNGHRQRPIPLCEVESCIEKGWELVAALLDERAIVKLPVHL